jgi:hypothetical protein
MKSSAMKPSKAISPVLIGLAVAIALIAAGCASGENGSTEVTAPPKPAKLRYYGGPKSPMG